jgi:hypothetical protein
MAALSNKIKPTNGNYSNSRHLNLFGPMLLEHPAYYPRLIFGCLSNIISYLAVLVISIEIWKQHSPFERSNSKNSQQLIYLTLVLDHNNLARLKVSGVRFKPIFRQK